jgi:hypothetical protein
MFRKARQCRAQDGDGTLPWRGGGMPWLAYDLKFQGHVAFFGYAYHCHRQIQSRHRANSQSATFIQYSKQMLAFLFQLLRDNRRALPA